MQVRTIETPIHGRVIYEQRDGNRLLVGFHGYAENAEKHFAELQRIPGIDQWSIAAVQGLRTFYSGRTNDVVANWMTSQDRELAIADNIDYVRNVIRSLPAAETLVFLGFSQGVAMAFRAGANLACAGIIALGGDVPPELRERAQSLPPVLLARGNGDDWYTEAKMKADLQVLRNVTPVVFEGGHGFTDAFRTAAAEFLSAVRT
jgi:predicted esterase